MKKIIMYSVGFVVVVGFMFGSLYFGYKILGGEEKMKERNKINTLK